MKNKILTALVTALTFAACEDPKPVTLRKPTATEAAIAAKPKAEPEPIAALKPTIDAGHLTQAEPTPELPKDTLALEHDQPKVDHLERAEALKAEGDLAGAITEARRALYTDGDDEDALKFIARVAPRTGRHAMAAEALGRVAQLHPDDAVPLISQTRALIAAKDFKAAMRTGREAVVLDDQNVEGWHALGRAHLSAGDLQSAIVAFEKAVELDPKHGYALNNLGLAYLRANENRAAAQVLERAAEALPHVAYVQNNLGVAYERLGHVDEAKAAYSQATALSPKYVKARINSDRVAKVQLDGDDATEPLPEDVNAMPETVVP
ncbi:MAG: tetratricopeptide repeat protein [Myxococcaceae bacterium]|nr:tetratricopeptide repeat protein [Myxococcaceae bacterium]